MPARLPSPGTSNVIYDDEEREFLLAMQRYKEGNRRPYPTWREVLAVVRSLGYRKVAPAEAPPTFKRTEQDG